ncbi:MAG: patatin-like phospholipase family protein [Minwuia sp.]|nr:patatin-like phospholipase family protein [Minwuia sp.]
METEVSDVNNQPRPKIGLALGAGIARGWAHIGVLERLERAGIRPDIICGTSIGALVGGTYAAGKLEVLDHWARQMTRGRMLRYLDIGLGSGGMLGGRRLKRTLQEHLAGIDIEDLPCRFASVTTELATGHEIWLQKGNLAEAITASYAMPGIFPPVNVNGRWLVDGAMVNPVPVSVCRALGARLVIAVNLNSDTFGTNNLAAQMIDEDLKFDELLQRIRANPDEMLSPSALVMRQVFGKAEDSPSIFSVLLGTLNIVQDRLNRSRMAGDPADIDIAPRLGHVGLLEFDRAEEAIEEGRNAVERALPALADAYAILA